MAKAAEKKFHSPNCLHVTWVAKTLGCEVEDIIQYGAKGDIDLLVNFDECDKPVYGYVMDYTEQTPDDNWLIRLSGGLAYYGEIESTDDTEVVMARLGGVWCVYRSDLNENQIGYPRKKPRLLAKKDVLNRGSRLDAEAKVTEIDNPFPDYWITRADFILLEALTVFDDPFDNRMKQLNEPAKILFEQVASLTEKLRQTCDQADTLTNLLQQAEDEIATLKVKVVKPEYMDPLHPRYAPKLAASVSSWVAYEPEPRKSPKQSLAKWLKDNSEKFQSKDGRPLSGFDDLAAIANWSTKGGAPKTPTKK